MGEGVDSAETKRVTEAQKEAERADLRLHEVRVLYSLFSSWLDCKPVILCVYVEASIAAEPYNPLSYWFLPRSFSWCVPAAEDGR